jgi:hypothetical protein
MVDHFVADDACRGQGPVLVDVVPEVGDSRAAAGHQHLGDAFHRIADRPEELVLVAYAARVLAREMQVLVDLALDHLLRIELQHLGGLVIDKGNRMEEAHVRTFVR